MDGYLHVVDVIDFTIKGGIHIFHKGLNGRLRHPSLERTKTIVVKMFCLMSGLALQYL